MEEQVWTCTACNKFATVHDLLLVGHQAQCACLPEEKREFRMSVLLLMVGGDDDKVQKVLELARTHDSSAYLTE